MICYYFPPLADVGSKRSVAFARYFRKHGWHPYVLSVKNPDKHYCSLGTAAPPEGVPVRYARSVANLSWALGKLNGALSRILRCFGRKLKGNWFYDAICYPDHFLGWIPLAALEGARIIRRQRVDAIYVSCTPFSGALVGIILKKLTAKPLVLDFRDPFVTGVASYFTTSKVRVRILSWFERRFVENADLLLVTSDETRAEYAREYPEAANKTFTVYNGFDPVGLPATSANKFEKFTVIYTGQFYNYGVNHRVHTDHFFRALADLQASGTLSGGNFQFLFYGDEWEFIQATAAEYGVSGLVMARSRVPSAEVLASISRSHLMLLRIVKLMISTKLFEGIPLNVPFLATIPRGEVETLIRQYSPGSYIVAEEDPPLAVAEAIKDAMARYQRGDMPSNRVDEFLACFTRERLSLEVMRLVEDRLPVHGGAR